MGQITARCILSVSALQQCIFLMSLSSLLFIPRLFKYSIMFRRNRGGREKNRYDKSYFMVSKEEIRPDSECVPGADAGCRCYAGSRHPVSSRLMRGHRLRAPRWMQAAGSWETTDVAVLKLKAKGCSSLSSESQIDLISSPTRCKSFIFPLWCSSVLCHSAMLLLISI